MWLACRLTERRLRRIIAERETRPAVQARVIRHVRGCARCRKSYGLHMRAERLLASAGESVALPCVHELLPFAPRVIAAATNANKANKANQAGEAAEPALSWASEAKTRRQDWRRSWALASAGLVAVGAALVLLLVLPHRQDDDGTALRAGMEKPAIRFLCQWQAEDGRIMTGSLADTAGPHTVSECPVGGRLAFAYRSPVTTFVTAFSEGPDGARQVLADAIELAPASDLAPLPFHREIVAADADPQRLVVVVILSDLPLAAMALADEDLAAVAAMPGVALFVSRVSVSAPAP